MPLKTLFLNPPSFENFDGGAGSRWPATREIESYWYPVWLAYPTGMLEGARLYADVVTDKPPGASLFYAAVFTVFGSSMKAVHLAATVWVEQTDLENLRVHRCRL